MRAHSRLTSWTLLSPWVLAFALFGLFPFLFSFGAWFTDYSPLRAAVAPLRVDGASDWSIFLTIVVPLMRPVLAVLAIQSFLASWNSFLYPLILVDSDRLRTLPVGLALLSQPSTAWTGGS